MDFRFSLNVGRCDAQDVPLEIDSQTPLDSKQPDDDIEGSGDPTIDEPAIDISKSIQPRIEHMLPINFDEDEQDQNMSSAEITCPKPCVCSIEGEKNNIVVDCSGYDLTELPLPLDPRVTVLKIKNNKLTEIPKELSELKNLKILSADNNSIMDLAAGSVSELPNLVTLTLANNRLIEYPKDLQNSISLDKLEELDLSGNDIRTELKPELFTPFKSLRKVTLPSTTSEFLEGICKNLKESLESICTESCKNQVYECPEAPHIIEDELFDAILPGMIPLNVQSTTNAEPTIGTVKADETQDKNTLPTTESSLNVTEFSLRSEINKEPAANVAFNSILVAPKETEEPESDVKIGAKTADTTKTGGVDKSIIGVIVAGMVVIVAVIAIKKNWSSIKKKFSSTPRPNERTANANGTTPEEVPLQDKTDNKLPV
ncbi:unnamed protein product [Leptidea sinapis]|uniref:Uncharacterized protein n=1 Tax=Leptidea sinapis TaxID=189913 RepID=A0A5E4PNX0_9NEOP|nr:unnamed protein product [Leptidea sinapis]